MSGWQQALTMALLGSVPCMAAAQAVADREPLALIETPRPAFLESVYEGGVRKNRGISIPLNLRTAPARTFSAGYTVSNSYLNPDLLVCMDLSCELEYQSDHTGNMLFLNFRRPVLDSFEVGVRVASYQMNNIPDLLLVHQLAGDDFLRTFHEDVLGEDSLPVLSNAPDGIQVFTMTDLADRRLTLDPGHRYRLPLQADLTRYFDIRSTPSALMSLNVAAHIAVPLEGDLDAATGLTALARGVDFGVSVNFIRARRMSPNLTGTYHVQLARFRNDVHVVNANSPFHGDDNLRSQYALTFGLGFSGTFGGAAPCSVALTHTATSANFDKQRYWTWDPLVFEGGNNLRGAILGANDYGVVSFACEHRRRRYQVSLVEDFAGLSQIFSDDGSGTSYDPDFAIGITVSWVPGSRRQGGME